VQDLQEVQASGGVMDGEEGKVGKGAAGEDRTTDIDTVHVRQRDRNGNRLAGGNLRFMVALGVV